MRLLSPSIPSILLLQARVAGDPMTEHEHRCFVERSGLPAESIVPHDLKQGPPSKNRLRRHDALTVGGSGEFYVSKRNLPEFEAYLDFMRDVVEQGFPTFSSCFGYQSIVMALGGEVIHDPPKAEVGTFRLTLTEHGRQDPLFGELPASFMAQLGHKDRASRNGDGALNLAGSSRCPQQALRIPDKPIWATQFHPELDRATNLDRFLRYMQDYGPVGEAERAEAAARFGESPEASSLLARFVRLVFG